MELTNIRLQDFTLKFEPQKMTNVTETFSSLHFQGFTSKEKQLSLKEKQGSILIIQLNYQNKACSTHKIKANRMVQNHAFPNSFFILCKK